MRRFVVLVLWSTLLAGCSPVPRLIPSSLEPQRGRLPAERLAQVVYV
jgi:hypothetical protein